MGKERTSEQPGLLGADAQPSGHPLVSSGRLQGLAVAVPSQRMLACAQTWWRPRRALRCLQHPKESLRLL